MAILWPCHFWKDLSKNGYYYHVPSHCALSLSTTSAGNSRKGVKYFSVFSRIQNCCDHVLATTLKKPCQAIIQFKHIKFPSNSKGQIFSTCRNKASKVCLFFVITRFAVNRLVISTICESCLGWLEITWTRSRSIMPGNFQLRRRRSSVLEHFCYRPQISL